MSSGLLLLLFFLRSSIAQNLSKQYLRDNFFDVTTKLKRTLLENYDRQVPAIYSIDYEGEALQQEVVNVTVGYVKFLGINQAQQTASVLIDVSYEWFDPRLIWDPKDYLGIETTVIGKKESIWIADVIPLDTLTFQDVLPEDQQFIDGNGEWSILKITVENSQLMDTLSPNYYAISTFVFELRRSNTYYVVLMIVPSFILTFLSTVGMFWETREDEVYIDRLNLGLTAILALVFVLQMMTADMPKISGMNKLSIYLMVSLGLITTASIVVVYMGRIMKTANNCKKDLSRSDGLKRFFVGKANWFVMAIFCSASLVNLIVLLI